MLPTLTLFRPRLMSMRAENSKFARTINLYKAVLCIFAFSAHSAETVTLHNSDTEVTYKNLSSLSVSHQAKVKTWLNFGINANKRVLGLPRQAHYYFDLNPRYFATEPVPWARIHRGVFDTIELHFYRYASLTSLKRDWTLYHELSHLYHPLFDYKDFWLAEGLATYLQNRVMLHNQLISRDEFIHRISAGLQRGKLNTKQNKGQLNSVSENMWQRNAYQRVYWTGVAFFIEAESQLKAQDKPDLVSLIKQYQMCCRENEQYASKQQAKQFLQSLDRLSRSGIFSSLYRRYQTREDFPVISKSQIASLITPFTPKSQLQ